MKKITQTKIHDLDNGVNGNCTAASFASILGLNLSDVPKLEDMKKSRWFSSLKTWLRKKGFILLEWKEDPNLEGYYLASGTSPRGFYHMVVYKNGKLAHDPHPSRAGVKDPDSFWALLSLDPSKHFKNRA